MKQTRSLSEFTNLMSKVTLLHPIITEVGEHFSLTTRVVRLVFVYFLFASKYISVKCQVVHINYQYNIFHAWSGP